MEIHTRLNDFLVNDESMRITASLISVSFASMRYDRLARPLFDIISLAPSLSRANATRLFNAYSEQK